LEIIKNNGRYAGLIRETPTGPFINLDSPGVPAPTATPELPEQDKSALEIEEKQQPTTILSPPEQINKAPGFDGKANRVFISHGKKRELVDQIKELLTFGSFEPLFPLNENPRRSRYPKKFLRICAHAGPV